MFVPPMFYRCFAETTPLAGRESGRRGVSRQVRVDPRDDIGRQGQTLTRPQCSPSRCAVRVVPTTALETLGSAST